MTLPSVVTTNTTSTVAANSAYLYRVRAIKAGTPSAWSAVDVASTFVFGSNVVAESSVISASDITQLRSAVNAVRQLASLTAASYTDANLSGVVMKPVHITELRNGLDAARQALALASWPYSTTAPVTGNLCLAAHVNDIRGGVR